MATNIDAIRPRRVDWRTQANADWYDGIPIVQAGSGGVEAGSTNAGNGSLVLAGLDPDTPFGAHVITVTAAGGLVRYTVEDPSGAAVGAGVSGLPCRTGGLTLLLTQGSTAFAVGDAFAVSVLPAAIDISGLIFALQARSSPQSATVALSGSSATDDPGTLQTLVNGGAGGVVGTAFDWDSPAWRVFAPSTTPYVYDLLAIDPETGRRKVAVYGTITHDAGVTHLP